MNMVFGRLSHNLPWKYDNFSAGVNPGSPTRRFIIVLSPFARESSMSAQLISGTALSLQLRTEITTRAAALTAKGRQPGLAVILVGEDPASQTYVKNKIKACGDTGISSILEKYPAEMAEAALLERIAALNVDPSVHGILVQMPLPKHINPGKVIEAIATSKDVDGYSVLSAGELLTGLPGFRPCTPYGCMKLIESTGVDLRGKHAVVIGRSNTVGKPMGLLLLQANATVTICHSATPDLGYHTRQADVVVAAVGRRNTLTADMVKPGAIVIDVGMNRDDAGKLCGDVDFEKVKEVAGYITPVPGGVGPMTITMLLMNTIESAERI
jgi:methylenetetrahydrofolate dehydrogenase (NADP+)/methenyltetrahydrofolate cyclohydrolase